jgi:hypothetical protein
MLTARAFKCGPADFDEKDPSRPADFFEKPHEDNMTALCIVGIKVGPVCLQFRKMVVAGGWWEGGWGDLLSWCSMQQVPDRVMAQPPP